MALSELIKYEGDNSTFIWKYPSEDFNCMTQLVVHESQEAIFFANGQAADTFGPGRYKLDSANIPILSKLLNLVTGISIFHCEVYFINKTVQMAVKWGTDSKVRFVEPTLNVPVEIGASGEMNLAISDGRKMVTKLVGTMNGIAWDNENGGFSKSLMKSFRPLISTEVKANLASAIKEKNIDIVEIDEHLTELSEVLRRKILPGFEEYGLTVPQFYLTNVVLPEYDPNFNKLRELHTITLQQREAEAKAMVKVTQSQADAKVRAAQREAILESETTATEVAKREAERKLLQAQVEAQAKQLAGMAEAAVMQAKGYNQKDVLTAEVQKAFAEGIGNMGPEVSNGGGSSMMTDMLGMGVGMAAINAMAPQFGKMMEGMNPNMNANPAGSNEANTNAGAPVPTTPAPEQSEEIVCVKCGNPLPKNAKFCLECGTKVEKKEPVKIICAVCGMETPKGKFCIECGAPFSLKCPNCGVEVPAGGKFCLECGTKL